jgi:hypothetical protein
VKLEAQNQEITWAQELIRMSWAYRAARALQTAHRLDLFAHLRERGISAAAIAAAEGWDADLLEKLLVVCAALELVEREREGWMLTPKGAATMLPEAPLYQGNAIAHSAEVWDFWHDLEKVVRGGERGTTASGEGADSIRSHRDFILAMHNMAMAGRAAELAERVDLSNKRTLVDVGGGPGTYTIALCQRYPDLRATLFDLPETIAIARDVIARFGLEDRISTVEGDWNEDEFGERVDAVLMSNILHGPRSSAGMKLAKARRALAEGGLLIIQDFLLDADKTGPLKPALFNLMVGAYAVDEISDLVGNAGFCDIRFHPMPADLGTTLLTALKE